MIILTNLKTLHAEIMLCKYTIIFMCLSPQNYLTNLPCEFILPDKINQLSKLHIYIKICFTEHLRTREVIFCNS